MGEISTPTRSEHPDVGGSERRYGPVDRGTGDLESNRRLRDLEGGRVTIALADGTLLKGATLVSFGPGRVSTLAGAEQRRLRKLARRQRHRATTPTTDQPRQTARPYPLTVGLSVTSNTEAA